MGLVVDVPSIIKGTMLGDSVAVNGVCLTVTRKTNKQLTFDIMPDTLQSTALKNIKVGDSLNCERAAMLSTRLGGHLVSGHVDTVGTIAGIQKKGELYHIAITVPKQFLKYVIQKGSVALDGISLTVQSVTASGFIVGIIPHTLTITTLGIRKPKDQLNVEFDMIGKYIENILKTNKTQSSRRLQKYLMA
jgi:riboflavin synthase